MASLSLNQNEPPIISSASAKPMMMPPVPNSEPRPTSNPPSNASKAVVLTVFLNIGGDLLARGAPRDGWCGTDAAAPGAGDDYGQRRADERARRSSVSELVDRDGPAGRSPERRGAGAGA